MCQEFCPQSGGVSAPLHAGIHTLPGQTPDTPPRQTLPGQTPAPGQTPPGRHPPKTATAADGMHPTGMHSCYWPQQSCGQDYVFTHVCDSVNRGGVLSQHALQVVSQHALQQVSGGCLLGGVCSGGVSAPGGSAPRGCGLLLWPSGLVAFWLKAVSWLKVVFCYGFQGVSALGGGLLVWPGLVTFWLKVVFCYGLLVWPSRTGGIS